MAEQHHVPTLTDTHRMHELPAEWYLLPVSPCSVPLQPHRVLCPCRLVAVHLGLDTPQGIQQVEPLHQAPHCQH